MSLNRYSSRRARRRKERWLVAGTLILLVALVPIFALLDIGETTETIDSEEVAQVEKSDESGAYLRADTPDVGRYDGPSLWGTKPDAVKGVYVAGPVAGSPALDEYINLAQETEINALVIDVKESGNIMYTSDVPLAKEIGATTDYIPNLQEMVERLKSEKIYTIARLSVFQDDVLPRERPELAVLDSTTGEPWLTYTEATWASAYDRRVWEYNVAIAKEAARAGFDEIQFDYVRFPSDGPMDQIQYGKETFPTQEDAIAGFLKYARSELQPMGVSIAADVFGLVGQNDYVGVGQVVSKMAPYLDVLCPMVYPSHYYEGSYGYPNPNAEPYGVIESAVQEFQAKARPVNPDLEIRPWLQDFDLGYPPYGPDEVKAQMQATYDVGETGWLLWNAANEYTEAALAPEGAGGGPEVDGRTEVTSGD